MQNRSHRPKPRLSRFARNLLEEWRRLDLPTSEATIVVAVSGGADSAALLLALDEIIKQEKLRLKLVVAHLDHGLRTESRKDAKWVKSLAKDLGHDAASSRVELGQTSKRKPNLEQAARNARYEFLFKTATRKKSKLVLTAHTLDDQAETILLRLLRGSAAEGLAGTASVRELMPGSEIKLVRPLLGWARRDETVDYCQARSIEFRNDEMNNDETFSRVKVRKQLLPLMKSFNNRIVEALSRTAALLSEDAEALASQARVLLDLAGRKGDKNETELPSLNVSILLAAPGAVRRRVLRQWILQARGDLRRVERVHLLAVEKLIEGATGGRVAELPGGMKVTRNRGILELSGKKRLKKNPPTSKIPTL
ncbi:MAG: tRNA lysidine(34) synthetase TilS [Acidobacteriota bacterium]